MKKILFFILIFAINVKICAQKDRNIPTKFPTEFSKNFTIPLGSKVLLELRENKNGKYEFRILSIEEVKGFYSFEKDENLYSKTPQINTIEVFFMGAFYDEGKNDKDYKSLLMLRSNLKTPLNYKADIKYYNKDNFENTSITGVFPGTNTHEIWAQKIDFITLYDFEKFKQK